MTRWVEACFWARVHPLLSEPVQRTSCQPYSATRHRDHNIKVHQHQKPTIWVSGGQLTYKSKHIRERSTRAINWRSSADIEVANGKSRGTVSLLEWAGIRAWSRVSRGSPTTPHKISGQILVLGFSILEELVIFDMFEDGKQCLLSLLSLLNTLAHK